MSEHGNVLYAEANGGKVNIRDTQGHFAGAKVIPHHNVAKAESIPIAEHLALCWNEHDPLHRRVDKLLSVMENIVSNLREPEAALRREQLEATINMSAKILDGVIAECKESQ